MKNFTLITILVFIALFSANSMANGTLRLAKEFNLIAVNGVEYKAGFFGKNSEVKLRAGINRLAIEFEEVYEGEDDDGFDVIKSGTFILQFYAEKDATLLQTILRPQNADAAKLFIKNPTTTIKDTESNLVSHTITPLQSDKLDFAILQTKPRQNAALDLSLPKSKKSKIAVQNNDMAATKNSRALEMLKYWWSQASEQEKKSFREEIADQ